MGNFTGIFGIYSAANSYFRTFLLEYFVDYKYIHELHKQILISSRFNFYKTSLFVKCFLEVTSSISHSSTAR